MEYCSDIEKFHNKDSTKEKHGVSMDLDLYLDMGVKESPNTKSNCEFTGDGFSDINMEKLISKLDYLISYSPNMKNEITYEDTIIETYVKLVQPEFECYISRSTKIGQDHYKDEGLIESVSRIAKILARHKPSEFGGLGEMNLVFERTMELMEDEIRNILEVYTIPNLGNKEDDFPCVSNDAICRMKIIVRVMAISGYETECCQVYTLLRRNAFKVAMKKSGFQKLSVDQIQEMSWQQLESYITQWTKAVKHTAIVLFPREQELCNQVFSNYPCIGQGIMTNLARAIIILFLNFVEEAIMKKKVEPEKLFKILEIYDVLTQLDDAMPSSKGTTSELKTEILVVQNRLGNNVINIFDNLEISIMNDAATNPVPNGVVHPLTRYTINYLRYACDFKDTLEHIFKEHYHKSSDIPFNACEEGSIEHSEVEDDRGEKCSMSSHYATKLVRIMDFLDANLDAKSRLYKDPSLRYVFLMNNGRYMLRKIKESAEMRELVGDISSRKRSTTLRVYHKNYQRETWGKVLQCLNHEGVQVKGKVNKPLLKERIKNFNQLFEGIHKTQGAWVVSDEQLLSELRVSISAVVIPAYRSFLASFKQHFIQGKERDKYIKFHPEDIEATIEKLFDGRPNTSTRMRK